MGFGNNLSGILTGRAGADEARHAARDAADQLRESSGQATGQLQPWSTFGRQAMVPLSELLFGKSFDPSTGKFTGDVADANRFNSFQQSPGYQYQMDEGLKAVERRNAATGTLLGGNTQKELQAYGSNLANQDYGNYINSLMGAAGVGQQADTGIANAYLNTGSQIAGYDYAGGMAKANQYNNLTNMLYSAIGSATGAKLNSNLDTGGGSGAGSVGGGQQGGYTGGGDGGGGGNYNSSYFSNSGAEQGASMTSLFSAFSDINLKENIKKIGEEKGFNIYEFNYKGEPERYQGVMAQEVQKIVPKAVFEKDGFLAVDYNKIGLEFKKI